MSRLFGVLVVVVLVAAACGGGDSNDSGSAQETGDAEETDELATGAPTQEPTNGSAGEPPGGLPAECLEAPYEITVNASAISGLDGAFIVDTAYATPQPIVPDPDQGGEGGNEQSQEEFLETIEESRRLAAETDLLLYAIWLADFPFEESDNAFLGGPDPQPGSGGTAFSLSLVPTTEAGFATGDVISASDTLAYETFTTFDPMLSFMVTDLEPEAFMLYSGEPAGTAEILYLDEEWICVSWDDVASTRNPDGDIAISGVILAPLTERQELPFN